jgi:hypothetical protein
VNYTGRHNPHTALKEKGRKQWQLKPWTLSLLVLGKPALQ